MSDSTRLALLEEDTARRLRQLKEAAKARADAPETAELSASSQGAIARQRELQDVIEKRKRARELAVPTNDNAVKLKLREFGEPICISASRCPSGESAFAILWRRTSI